MIRTADSRARRSRLCPWGRQRPWPARRGADTGEIDDASGPRSTPDPAGLLMSTATSSSAFFLLDGALCVRIPPAA